MTSNPPVGHEPSLRDTSPSTLSENTKDLPPEVLAQLIMQRELENKKLEWASWVETEFVKCKNARAPFERQWYLNLAFTGGKQYVSPLNIPGYGFRLTTPKAPAHRVRLVINKIRPVVRTECSKLTTSKPIPTVMPATNEDEDWSAAAVAEQLLKSRFANAQFEQTYRSWIWWGVVCGTSFLKQYYDPNSEDPDSKQLPPAPSFPNGQPLPPELLDALPPEVLERFNTPQPAMGKICMERLTPFHVYVPDLLSEDLCDQAYVIHVMTKTPLWVKNKFGFQPQPDTKVSNTILDAAYVISKGSEEHQDAVLVKEVWIKPGGHKDFPNGGMLTVIANKVVQYKDSWPYPFKDYPFYKYNGIPTGGFYSDSVIVDLISPQKEYNKKRSQALEITNTMGKPKLLYPRGSINPRMISSEPGQSIPYQPGYEKPEVMQGVEVPASFTNEITQLQEEIDDISGQHEISRGQTSLSSLTSGTAIAYLQEQDDAKLNYQVASIENATELYGKHYLELCGKYWDENRLVKIVGKNNSFEALHWKKNLLKGNTDVKVQTGSALPFSKSAKQALLTEWMQNGFIDPSVGLEMMNFGGMDKALEDQFVDKRAAMRENLKMADLPDSMLQLLLEPAPGEGGTAPYEAPGPNGKPQQFNGDGSPFQPQPPVPVNSWDNHEEHIYWHNHYRKTQEFELLSPLKKKAFELHVQLHQLALAAQQFQGFGGNQIPNPNAPQQGGFGQDQGFGGNEGGYEDEQTGGEEGGSNKDSQQ